MSISLTNEIKNTITMVNESKTGTTTTWEEHEEIYDESGQAGDTWAEPGTPFRKESKNIITMTNESKN